jgi:hypothetical protein
MRLLLGIAVIFSVASCSSQSASGGPAVGAQGGSGVLREIVVENNVNVDIQISAIVGSRTLTMGTVQAQSRRSVRLPNAVDTPTFRLMAEPRGNTSMANRLYSEPIQTSEVNNATWEIRQNIAVVVYGRRGTVTP